MIYISQDNLDRMLRQAREQLPIECCGMLAGIVKGESIEITEIYPMTNVDQSPEHFSLDPKEQFAVYYAVREKGIKLVGNYHSHPATPARPSAEDIRLAHDPKAVYLIISLKEESPVVKVFFIRNGAAAEVPLNVT